MRWVPIIVSALIAGGCGRIGYDPLALSPIDGGSDIDGALPDAGVSLSLCDRPPTTVERLSLGYLHGCYIDDDGTLHCWGDNEHGQLGRGSDTGEFPDPEQVGVSDQWFQVQAGLRHTCALDCQGGVWCWGQNDRGQLGNNEVLPGTFNLTPTPISLSRRFKELFVKRNYACAIAEDDTLWCWGSNNARELGIGTQDDTSTPTQVVHDPAGPRDDDWRTLGLGDAHTCCAKGSDSSLWCWGANGNGQLGAAGAAVVRARPNLVAIDRTWLEISSGLDATCALDSIGALWCWGRNDSGQGGHNDQLDRDFPTQITSGETFKTMEFGYTQVCAVATSGALYCWGSNTIGELGLGPTQVGTPQLTAAQVGADTDWLGVRASQDFGCGVRPTGIYCWGENQDGRLGLGDTVVRDLPSGPHPLD
jgi:alpha-tubulin suppressor-like RCC1 family protein